MKTKIAKHSVAILIILFPFYLFGQVKSKLSNAPNCTLSVNMDNGKSMNIWINGIIRGKTPLQIDTLTPGFYDVSFIKPTLRDSILNLTNSNSNEIRGFGQGSELIDIGNSSYFLFSGELARESNCKFTLHPNDKKEIMFHIQGAKEEMNKGHTKSLLLISVGVMIGMAFLIFGIVISQH